MYAFVTHLCSGQGRRYRAEELRGTTPVEGELSIGPVDPRAFPSGFNLTCQPRSMARLKYPGGGKRGLSDHLDLFDPQLVSMDERGFILRGFERFEDPKGVRMTMQAWLVRMSRW